MWLLRWHTLRLYEICVFGGNTKYLLTFVWFAFSRDKSFKRCPVTLRQPGSEYTLQGLVNKCFLIMDECLDQQMNVIQDHEADSGFQHLSFWITDHSTLWNWLLDAFFLQVYSSCNIFHIYSVFIQWFHFCFTWGVLLCCLGWAWAQCLPSTPLGKLPSIICISKSKH